MIPSSTNEYDVIRIGDDAFMQCQSLTSITIPNTIKSSGICSFQGCDGLKKVIVSDISSWCKINFYDPSSNPLMYAHDLYKDANTKITNLDIPNSVNDISDYAFFGCTSITNVSIPSSVKTIGENTFQECTELSSIVLPNSVVSIGNSAFYGCSVLKSIEMSKSLQRIGDFAFFNCGNLESITIPNTVIDIGEGVFGACENLKSIIVDKGNTVYDSRDNCNAIIKTSSNTLVAGCNYTVIPNSVTAIGNSAFYSLTLPSFSLPNSIKSIGDQAFIGCGFTELTIPNSVEVIGVAAFEYSKITNIIIPNSVKTIKDYAFSDCYHLTTVTLGSSLEYIGHAAFDADMYITSVYSHIKNIFAIDSQVFPGCENATLYVPYGFADIYKHTSGWNRFKNIVEMEQYTTIPLQISCNTKGSISINFEQYITGKISAADINEGTDNTFTFTPKPGCKLDQVILNGLDITTNVENNILTCTIPANSQMIVTFSSEQGDMNNDGTLDISDVVSIVNKILGN